MRALFYTNKKRMADCPLSIGSKAAKISLFGKRDTIPTSNPNKLPQAPSLPRMILQINPNLTPPFPHTKNSIVLRKAYPIFGPLHRN
mmetsp:Transcript_52517/g.61317  ORF Transcript_52517/g.61317 Transcript_52517/m.61317 type:complete len:87 (-) Transcript_52517:64-324(-)